MAGGSIDIFIQLEGKPLNILEGVLEGRSPSDQTTSPSLIKGGQGYLIFGESKRGEASLIQPIPLPLIKGKGIKGIGLKSLKGEGYPNLKRR